jgi:hypothetical protein
MLNHTDEIETVLFQALAHPTRRTIIRIAQSRTQGITYTELITELALSTGKLNYHLDQLKGILEKNNTNSYVLTSFGKRTVEHLKLVEQNITSVDEEYVRLATTSQRTSLQPIVKAILLIGIAMIGLFITIWAFIGYIAISEGAPLVIYVVLPILFVIGFAILSVLIYALIRTPLWLKRFEHRFFGNSN